MTAKIGYNVLNLPDRPAFLTHITRLQPAALLFYAHNNAQTAREVARMLPGCQVILRFWPDDNPLGRSPEQWIEQYARESWVDLERKIWLYTNNESGFSPPVIDWITRVAELGLERGLKLVVGNFNIGTPEPEAWARARKLLELAGAHPDQIHIGVHEGCGGVMTSGLIGGSPADNDLINPANWPASTDTITCWHSGRHKFMWQYCDSVGIPRPKVIVTEFAWDWTSDIAAWLRTLKATGADTVSTFRTLEDQWKLWWPQWTLEQAMYEQVHWAANTVWQGVEAALFFCWGTDGHWNNHDVSGLTNLQERLEAGTPSLPTTPPVVIPPPPDPLIAWRGQVRAALDNLKILIEQMPTP